MDCRCVLLCWAAILLMLVISFSEGRHKKVVIHIPYKVKKIKHTHTVFKTIHHHHSHHEPGYHLASGSEDHEHYHHQYEDGAGQHSQPVPGIGIPEFLPDVPLEMPLDLPDRPRELPPMPPLPLGRLIPLYRP